ncbi:hypothetical protein [Staphylococcus borealis]|uniref:hypothetical protein n=1 Tax=Staphylococcus borealis TaxID=2742203 RepID=UPI00211C91FA|nr:hypothetical protein [Staphylococcus borealis]MCQ9279782.1 hypothetical protein [Staphylococcus borealis]
MFEEIKDKPELNKAVVNITLSISVLSTIAVIIRMFTKNPPELWVSSLNIAGTISIIFYMGLFNSKFTYYRWLIISKKTYYILFQIATSILMFILPYIILFIAKLVNIFFYKMNSHFTIIDVISNFFQAFIINLIFIFSHAMSFTIIVLLLMTVVTRKLIKGKNISM